MGLSQQPLHYLKPEKNWFPGWLHLLPRLGSIDFRFNPRGGDLEKHADDREHGQTAVGQPQDQERWMELDRTNNKSLKWHLNIRIMWDDETWKLYETIMFKFHLKILVNGFVWSWFGSHYPLIFCKLVILPCVGLPCLVLIKATYHILIERNTSIEIQD